MNASILALDVGTVRVGVASARLDVRIAQPLTAIPYDRQTIVQSVDNLIREHGATALVVGWPRGLEGQSTQQTTFVEELATELRTSLAVPVHLQDEALTSLRAEAELQQRKRPYVKADVDALAAAYILDDYLRGEEVAANAHQAQEQQ